MGNMTYNKFTKLIGAVTLTGFFAFLLISYFTLHIHYLPDGRQIVHSHLFPGNVNNNGTASTPQSRNNHSHTNIEFLYYSHLSLDKISLSFILFVIAFYLALFTIFRENLLNSLPYTFQSTTSLRAPPVS